MAKKLQEIQDNEAIHGWFELSYANYLVLPRSVLQSAPPEWQRKFVSLLEELEKMFGKVPEDGHYVVSLKDDHNHFIHDTFKDYQRGRRQIPTIKEGKT